MSTIGSLVGVLTTLSRVYDKVNGRKDGETVGEALKTLDIDKTSMVLQLMVIW